MWKPGSVARRAPRICSTVFAVSLFLLCPAAFAGFVGDYALTQFTLTNTNANGSVAPIGIDAILLTGGNNGSGIEGFTDLLVSATGTGPVSFSFGFSTLDRQAITLGGSPWDSAFFLLNGTPTLLASTDGVSGNKSFNVTAGQKFGFRVATSDNTGEPGLLTVSNFSAPQPLVSVPEPSNFSLTFLAVLIGLFALISKIGGPKQNRGRRNGSGIWLTILLASVLPLRAQTTYAGQDVTGQFVLVRTVNVSQLAGVTKKEPAEIEMRADLSAADFRGARRFGGPQNPSLNELLQSGSFKRISRDLKPDLIAAPATSLTVSTATSAVGFASLSHYQMRTANNGNQFSIEPPNPSFGISSGMILYGVNNAIQVYSQDGTAQLPKVLSSNELFGVSAAIDRTTGVQGVYPTDMRVHYDQTINRWIVLQRSQANDSDGFSLPSSKFYMAVSRTADPLGDFNIYEADTTDSMSPSCPCIADYPQIGADDFGFYIASNEYNAYTESFMNAQIHAISKQSLADGAVTPTVYRFVLPFVTGYEFAIQPAYTPPGANSFVANGGLEWFVSSHSRFTVDDRLAVWAMYNTSSLRTAKPSLVLTQTLVTALQYTYPDLVTQKPGPLPYGSTLSPPGRLAFIDGGDLRVQSVVYSGGRLYVSVATQANDDQGKSVVGSAYAIFSPTFRGGVMGLPLLRSGVLTVRGNHMIRPAFGINPDGKGAIAVTLVGPDFYPSAAFIPFDTFGTPTTLQIAAPGTLPEDGFTGYQNGVARWGDYSSAVATSDGVVWMTTQYIPSGPRAGTANWGTYVFRFLP
jgi:hypothetical protein